MIIVLAVLGYVVVFSVIAGGMAVGRWASVLVADVMAQRSRRLDLEERTIAVQELRAKSVPVPASIPADLTMRIQRWGDPDAQGNERKVILDLYAEFEDWDRVRQHLPPEPKDDASVERELFLA